jgi:PAS domain-containing protein
VERLEVRQISLFEKTIPVEPGAIALEILSDTSDPAQRAGCGSKDQFLPALFKAIPVPLVIFRIADGAILYANEHYCSTFGLATDSRSDREALLLSADRAEQISKAERRITDFYYDPADWQTLLQVLSTKGYLRDYEVRMQQVDGTPLWCAVSLQWLTFNGEQAILGVFITSLTTSRHQKRSSSNLQRSTRFCLQLPTTSTNVILFGIAPLQAMASSRMN